MRSAPSARQPRFGEGSRAEEPTSRVFTDYLRRLGGQGDPPDRASLEAVWQALRGALVGELKKRGLWSSPPSYLGIYGSESWTDEPGSGDPLDELVSACYSFTFVERLRALRGQLRVKPNIDGLVFLNVRNFIHERQKQHDPLGYHLFGILRAAVRAAVEAGDLQVVSGNPRVRNDTVLAAAPPRRLAAASPRAEAADEDGEAAVAASVAAWCADLLPDLVTARGQRREALVATLGRRLGELAREGPPTLDFKQLMDALKAEVRSLWAALFEQTAGEVGVEPGEGGLETVVQLYHAEEPADRRLETRESFRKLTACVSATLERLVIKERTRLYLTDLWQFLRIHAAGDEEASPAAVARVAAEEKLPSQRKLAELLVIPRDRLPELYDTLGGILQRCRAAISEKASVTPLWGERSGRRAHPGGLGDDDV